VVYVKGGQNSGVVILGKLRRAKRDAILINHECSKRAKRIVWVSLVVDVAVMSVAILRDSSRVFSSSSRLASCERSEPATPTLVATSSLRLL